MTKIPIAEAGPLLAELVRKVQAGEEVILLKGDEPAVKLVPISEPRPPRRVGTAKDVIRYIAEDFDAPLPEFEDPS